MNQVHEHSPPVQAPTWLEVGALSEVPRQGARIVVTVFGDVAVFRTIDDRVFALLDRCPHLGGPLSQGLVVGHRVVCPLHNWMIELDSGDAVAPDQGCTLRFPVRVKDGIISLGLPSQATG